MKFRLIVIPRWRKDRNSVCVVTNGVKNSFKLGDRNEFDLKVDDICKEEDIDWV